MMKMQEKCVLLVLVAALFHMCNGLRIARYGSHHMHMSVSLSSPPTTFIECSRQAAIATRKCMEQGQVLMEVEFPPLPLEYLEDSSSSARDIADANTRWAIEFAKSFTNRGQISIIYPDKPELDDAIRYVDMKGGANPFPNITLATIRSDSISNAGSIDQIIGSIFGATVGGTVEGIPNTYMYVALVSSTQELTDLEKLHKMNPKIPIIFFNLRLDFLRGDLGLPLFPGRELHHRFLSTVKPSFLMRSRAFATSLRKPPFIVNYSGLLYRAYPEPYQCILNTGNNKNKVVKTCNERPSNKEFRDALTESLIIPGVSKSELQTTGNLVWWEKETEKEISPAWRQ